MDRLADWLIEFVSHQDNPLGLLVLAASAMIEYVIPPFPGDTITLFGAVLITAYGWSFAGVFGAVMAGSIAGSMLAFYAGGAWQRRRERRPGHTRSATLDKLIARFHRHGAVYLVLNRFLPGFRAVFFVAAGMAGMRARAVLAYGALSAALFNLAIVGAGAAVGLQFDELVLWARRYALAVWIAVGALVAVWIVRALWRRHR